MRTPLHDRGLTSKGTSDVCRDPLTGAEERKSAVRERWRARESGSLLVLDLPRRRPPDRATDGVDDNEEGNHKAETLTPKNRLDVGEPEFFDLSQPKLLSPT
jgi:hypothetical protein